MPPPRGVFPSGAELNGQLPEGKWTPVGKAKSTGLGSGAASRAAVAVSRARGARVSLAASTPSAVAPASAASRRLAIRARYKRCWTAAGSAPTPAPSAACALTCYRPRQVSCPRHMRCRSAALG